MSKGAAETHVVLVSPEIPWNTGNAGRTCLAGGARLHLVEPLGFSLEEKAVRRAGLDYWPRVAPQIWPAWERFETDMTALGEPFLFSPEGDRDHWDVIYPERTVLVFGPEHAGFPPEVRARHSARLVRVPMVAGTVRSLNVSTCIGIVLYERLRQLAAARGQP